jgi:hypothetical protein
LHNKPQGCGASVVSVAGPFTKIKVNINEEITCKTVFNCTNVIELTSFGKFLYEIKCKWENERVEDLS